MKIHNRFAAATLAGMLTVGGAAGTATAAHQVTHNPVSQTGGALGGLVAAVLQLNITDVEVNVVRVGDVNVALENVLNNNRILQNFLNNNDIDVTITDVVDVTIVDNIVVLNVLSTSSIADLDLTP